MDLHLEHVAARLHISKAGHALCTGWEAAMFSPPEQALRYLEPAYIAQAAHEVALTDAMIRELVAFADRIKPDEAVVAFFWYCHHRILNDHTLVLSWEEQWPPLDEILGEEAGLLNVLVMLSAVPEMRETYRRLGIPGDIVQDTVADLRLWMETDLYYQRYKRWGIVPLRARWLCRHWQGILLQLKRLQFCMDTFGGHLRAYRKREGRKLVALSDPGIRYCKDGNAWCDLCGDASDVWTSRLKTTDEAVFGNEISPDGLAHPRTLRLPLNEWELALAPGEAMLSLHIPANGPMGFDDCGESIHVAMEIFPRYFPEYHFQGFETGCWFLDTRLQPLLSPESNIIRMQRELYLFPGLQGDNQQIHQRVFGWDVTDISKVTWRTSLQKAVGNYLRDGGHFHGGFGFLLKEDVNWGSKVYQS